MNLSSFGKISREALLAALGYQKIPTYSYRQLDVELSGCLSCQDNQCHTCPHKIYTDKTECVHDRHNIGSQDTLKSISLKLFILLHYSVEINTMPGSGIGLIKDVSRSYLARTIGCDKKSIDNNLEKLAAYGYITYSHTGNYNFYNIGICNYAKMFKTAREGNYAGYLELDTDILTKILKTSNINDLRGLLQLIDGTLSNVYRGQTKKAQMNLSTTGSHKIFPRYVRPGILKKAYQKQTDMFEIIEPEYKDDGIIVILKDTHNPADKKNEFKQAIHVKLDGYFSDLRAGLMMIDTNANMAKQILLPLGIEMAPDLHNMSIALPSQKDLNDLYQMAEQYNADLVLAAYTDAYNFFIRDSKEFKQLPVNIGSYIRSNIRERLRLRIAA